MSDTAEYNAEALLIALIALQLPTLNTAGGIVHFDISTQTSAATIDRITVKAEEKTVLVAGLQEGYPKVWQCTVTATVTLATNSPSTLDDYMLAIGAAVSGSAPAAVVTQCQTLFPSGGGIFRDMEGGEHEGGDNERTRSRAYQFIFNA